MNIILTKKGVKVTESPIEGKDVDMKDLIALLTPKAGDTIVFNGSFWEAGTANVKVTVADDALNMTWQEIKDALDAGRIVNIADVSADATVVTQIVAAKKESTDYNVYIAGGEDPAYVASAADGYPAEAAQEPI